MPHLCQTRPKLIKNHYHGQACEKRVSLIFADFRPNFREVAQCSCCPPRIVTLRSMPAAVEGLHEDWQYCSVRFLSFLEATRKWHKKLCLFTGTLTCYNDGRSHISWSRFFMKCMVAASVQPLSQWNMLRGTGTATPFDGGTSPLPHITSTSQ